MDVDVEAAEKLMHKQQKLRDHFTNDFLDRDDHDPALYDMLFNNDRVSAGEIAHSIAAFVLQRHGERCS
jgi:hypothetical protein